MTSDHAARAAPATGGKATVLVVPCGHAKLAVPAPARSLYNGSMFRYCFATVERQAALTVTAGTTARVFILSARHGLLDPDTEVAPYEQTMTSAGAVTADLLADQLASVVAGDAEVVAYLPRAYLSRLRDAVDLVRRHDGHEVVLRDAYEAAPGIGYQRQVLAALRRSQDSRSHRAR